MDFFVGEIRAVSFNFPPKGWALCNGQLLPISQNQALFSLLGTTYGGDGRTNFALPNLQGRAPMHLSSLHALGQSGGEVTHTLTNAEMPAHTHAAAARSTVADSPSPAGRAWATQPATQSYGPPASLVALAPAAVSLAGAGQPHSNLQPYLVLNFVIALQGIFPSQN
ncbi:MAG: tail fiber protein [Myxococcales bacterium]